MADLMQQAREQFEAWATAHSYCFTRLAPYDYHDGEARAAWAAWQAALRAAPEGFVLVPVEPTPEMLDAAASFGGRGGYSAQRGDDAVEIWADMLAARPQGVSHGR